MRMRLISAITNFYWSHAIALQKLSNERSYKFSWISSLTEVISIRIVGRVDFSQMLKLDLVSVELHPLFHVTSYQTTSENYIPKLRIKLDPVLKRQQSFCTAC